MSGLFQDKTTFNDDIGDWDVSNVTDMNKMFYTSDHSGIFNQDISGWDVSSVTDMNTMFKNNHVFNQDISGWDVSSVTNMSDMFKYTENLETDLSNWDVSNVTHMGTMFFHAENIIFSEGFASWDVSNVTNFGYMFIETTFNMDISSWDVSSATNMSGMFLQTNISDENKCAIHTSFSSNGNWPYDWSGSCPPTPTGLVVTPGIAQNVLTWTANGESNLASYKVYGGTSASPATLLSTVTSGQTYTNSSLTNGTLYYYNIKAVDNAGNESSVTSDVSSLPHVADGDYSFTFDGTDDYVGLPLDNGVISSGTISSWVKFNSEIFNNGHTGIYSVGGGAFVGGSVC